MDNFSFDEDFESEFKWYTQAWSPLILHAPNGISPVLLICTGIKRGGRGADEPGMGQCCAGVIRRPEIRIELAGEITRIGPAATCACGEPAAVVGRRAGFKGYKNGFDEG